MTENPDVLAVASQFKHMASEILLETSHTLTWDDAMTLANLKLKACDYQGLKLVTAQPIRLLAYLITYGLEPGRVSFAKIYCSPKSVNEMIVNCVNELNRPTNNTKIWGTVTGPSPAAGISAAINFNQPEESTMKTKAQTAIETSPKVTITFIYGKIAVDMSVSELLEASNRLGGEADSVSDAVAKTAYGKAKLKELQAAQAVVAALLDKHQAENQDFTV